MTSRRVAALKRGGSGADALPVGRLGTRRLVIGALIVGAVAVASASAVVFEGRDDSGSEAAVRSGSATSSTSSTSSTTSTSTSTSTTSTSRTAPTTTGAPTTAPPAPTTQTPPPQPTPPPTPIALSPPPPALAPQCNNSSNGVIDAMNADRTAAGLAPLCSNGGLAAYAQRWATWMAQNQSLTHQDLQTVLGGTGFSTVGENLLEGPGSMSPAQMEVSWMNSPPHRQNILSGAYTAAGVGMATDGTGQIWVVVDFGG